MAVAQSFGGGDSHAIANWMVDATEQWILENSKLFLIPECLHAGIIGVYPNHIVLGPI